MSFLYSKARRIVGLVSTLLLLSMTPVHAVELGLTPSHVFATWMNINETLVALGGAVGDGEGTADQLRTMQPKNFNGKKPGEVLQQLVAFRGKLDRLGSRYGQKPVSVYEDPEGGVVTPSVVFMNSGHVLDSSILLLISLDETRLVSDFFTRYDISGKTPDGPYSLVDLANRRMDVLLN